MATPRSRKTNRCKPMSTCGHSGCKGVCNVRYVGATSQIRDHHMMHAAKGSVHIWTAAIVTGLALVITGAIAFNTAQANSDYRAVEGQHALRQELNIELQKLNIELQKTQALLAQVAVSCDSGE